MCWFLREGITYNRQRRRLTCVGVYIEVMHALLDLYIIGSEVKNLKRIWKILNMKVVKCM
jgi:hypothetical protein